jgi:hypothetical protein
VQGGHYEGKPAKSLELKAGATTLYSKTQPVHWATGADLPGVDMEQWITLEGPLAHVRFRMNYRGEETHAARHQEIPAFFVEPRLGTLVFYDGQAPRTGGALTRKQPNFPNESIKLTEQWAAWVDDTDRGVGLCVPVATEATCYRSPLATFALKPGLVWEYDAWMTLGSVEENPREVRGDCEKARPVRVSQWV